TRRRKRRSAQEADAPEWWRQSGTDDALGCLALRLSFKGGDSYASRAVVLRRRECGPTRSPKASSPSPTARANRLCGPQQRFRSTTLAALPRHAPRAKASARTSDKPAHSRHSEI